MNMLLAAANGQRLRYVYPAAHNDSAANLDVATRIDLDAFVAGACEFFTNETKQGASVGSPYIARGRDIPAQEFTATMRVSGAIGGDISFTASRAMLTIMLMRMGSDDITTPRMRALLKRLAMAMSMKARTALGDDVLVSEPVVTSSRDTNCEQSRIPRALVTPFHWRKFTAQLAMSLN